MLAAAGLASVSTGGTVGSWGTPTAGLGLSKLLQSSLVRMLDYDCFMFHYFPQRSTKLSYDAFCYSYILSTPRSKSEPETSPVGAPKTIKEGVYRGLYDGHPKPFSAGASITTDTLAMVPYSYFSYCIIYLKYQNDIGSNFSRYVHVCSHACMYVINVRLMHVCMERNVIYCSVM